jgi:hypothetical protein
VTSHEVLEALREFVERIGPLDRVAGPAVTVSVDGDGVVLGPAVAGALAEALRAYRDPRERGTCDFCGGRQLDQHFRCGDCGRSSGIFGQMISERAGRYVGPPGSLPAAGSS